MAELTEDPDYWCDKQKRSGKFKDLFCGRNLNHKGNCGPFFFDEEREHPWDVEGAPPATEDQGAEVLPFVPREGDEVAEEAGVARSIKDRFKAALPNSNTLLFTQPAGPPEQQAAPEPPAEDSAPPPEPVAFRQPTQAPVFEEPDLRGRDGYQHPVTGEKVPGVTTISGLIDKSSFLVPWGAKLAAEWAAANADLLAMIPDEKTRIAAVKSHAEKLRHEGRDIGSLAHNTIEAIIRGEEVQVDPSVQPQVDGFIEWRDRFVQQIVLSEATVWSDVHKYAGTMDLAVLLKDGRLVCVDIKTGKDVHEDAALQLNALCRAEKIVSTNGEIGNLPFVGAGVLHLPQPVLTATGKASVRGRWSYRPVELRDVDWHTFLHLRQVWEWEKAWSSSAIGGKQTMLPGVAS